MTPADCAAPVEFVEAVNPADVQAIDTLLLHTAMAEAREIEKADCIAARSPTSPFPATKHPELRAAIKLARVAREVMAEAYVESDLRREAYYAVRDGEELKAERKRAADAVPFPPELTVPRKKDSKPFISTITIQYSDGSTRVSEGCASPGHVSLEYEDAADSYYADDPEAARAAKRLIQRHRCDQFRAGDNLPAIKAADDYLKAHFPVVRAARQQRKEALKAIEAVRPHDLQTALEKARALGALDYCHVSDKGVCYNAGLRENYDDLEAHEAVLATLWVDLRRLVSGEEDVELVALGAKHAELDEQVLKIVDEHRGPLEALAEKTHECDHEMRQIVDRSLALRATSLQGLRAKALIADAHQPPEGTYEYDELPWMVARSLISDAMSAG